MTAAQAEKLKETGIFRSSGRAGFFSPEGGETFHDIPGTFQYKVIPFGPVNL